MLTATIDQFKQAANGWKNLLVKNNQAELLFQQRSDICNRCEHKTPLTCGLCGCPLAAKLRAVEASCPDKLW
jgi:hypothetical protein